MKRSLLCCLLLSMTQLASSGIAADQPPNVLFIAIDDLNDWVEPFGGHPQAKTPHLAQFARDGAVVFQNAHCAGPVCGPSRSALLSGFMPHRSGVYGNSQNMLNAPLVKAHATLPEYFSNHGYVSMSRGKIFHRHATKNGSDPGHWAFDIWVNASGNSGVDTKHVTSRNRNLINGKPGPPTKYARRSGSEFSWGPSKTGKEETRDYQTAKWAAEHLMARHEKPFFMAIGLSKPHLPFYAPREFYDLYDLDSIQVPLIQEDDLDDILNPAGKPKFRPTEDYLWLKQNELFEEVTQAYLATSSYADDCLGVMFDALADSPNANNTIVVVWGDHGWHLGEKLRYRKATGWHESTRVPLMIRLPGMKSRQDCTRLVNLIDLYPTLIDLCDLPAKPEIDGQSIGQLLETPEADWQSTTLTIHGEGNASVHGERWHLIHYKDGTRELYDLESDPMEWRNMITSDDAAAIEARNRLTAAIPTEFAKGIPQSDPKFKSSARGIDKTIKRQGIRR